MHESVLEYTPLLAMQWGRRLSNAMSELERVTVLMDLWEHVHERALHDEMATYMTSGMLTCAHSNTREIVSNTTAFSIHTPALSSSSWFLNPAALGGGVAQPVPELFRKDCAASV
jgi:hypothetical protein